MAKTPEELVGALIKDPARVKPKFMSQPDMDKLVAVVMRLAMENGVLRDRVIRQEELLKSRGILKGEDYASYEPNSEITQASQAENFKLISAIAKDLG